MRRPSGRVPPSSAALAAALAIVAVLAGCELAPPAGPSASPSEAPFVPPPAPATSDVLACIDIVAPECSMVAERILAGLPGIDGRPFSIRVQLDACLGGGNDCPRSLVARSGAAVVEYPDGGAAIRYTLEGPPAAPVIERDDDAAWTEPIQPGSPFVEGEGPFEFEIGHCGLLHAVDFDGSFWVLVGDYDGDHEAMYGSERGSIDLAGPERARYLGGQQQVFELARFPGAKRFQPCR